MTRTFTIARLKIVAFTKYRRARASGDSILIPYSEVSWVSWIMRAVRLNVFTANSAAGPNPLTQAIRLPTVITGQFSRSHMGIRPS